MSAHCGRLAGSGIAVLILSCGGRLAEHEVLPVRNNYPAGVEGTALLADSSASLMVVLKSDQPYPPPVESIVEVTSRNRPSEKAITDGQRVDRDGTTQFVGLAPGSYRLRAASLGFKPVLVKVDLTRGCRTRVDITMAIEHICETPEAGCPVTTPRVRILTCRTS